ncbi:MULTISPECIES: heat-inducible transcriptional repressor HrcA [unclassified Pseudactinotalea]|uniref:heat-inducible transcriptional repressor HrcA n=1 Tax=unclassified Pseudactinotalea TaxID=2649176 RepID=UPI00128DA4B4|nr:MULTISPECIES: heat-inducible transcriptional repressor HrcA [unclassified Pseudactinotalea]MPV49759.1 heat-inducible transcriptional repressor HrcA [Pseudactinotalea sp. HY160]QGH69555.1 heat-inducible transcriptional repressor HrcA [Pseudactinotalea sp. HY158]
MTRERHIDVLRAIVQDYVHTREPVGSRSLVERHNLGVSPATIRNDMALLEEAGLITQPHTSAGRIPTDAGYRLFVDRLDEIKPLSAAERRAIGALMQGAVDLDDALERTVRLLAQLTQQVAVVRYPSLRRSALRHVELLPASSTRILMVIISDNGQVEQRTIEADEPLTEELLAELRARINAAGAGRRMPELATALHQIAASFPAQDQPTAAGVVTAVLEVISDEIEERIVMAGTAHLARTNVDFSRTISPVLEALEEQVVMLRLLSDMASEPSIAVRIGSETHDEALLETSVVAGRYSSTDAGVLGQLGVIGPTRMDYPTTMAAVHAVARYLSKTLS